jgi:hypothetical protein
MECTNLVAPIRFTVVFVLFCIYTPDDLFPRPIVNQSGGLFWILSDSNVSFDGQSSFFPGVCQIWFHCGKGLIFVHLLFLYLPCD